MSKLILGVLASGNGSNCKAIQQAIADSRCDARIGMILSNNPDAGVLAYAHAQGIPAVHMASETYPIKSEFAAAMLDVLKQQRVELIVLAGYMRKLSAAIISVYRNRILNIHPALLPAFGGKGMYGHHVHEAVIASGSRITGATVHLVDEQYDEGPIVMQKAIEVSETDTAETLAAKVLTIEHEIYYRAIQLFAEGRITVQGRKVLIRQ